MVDRRAAPSSLEQVAYGPSIAHDPSPPPAREGRGSGEHVAHYGEIDWLSIEKQYIYGVEEQPATDPLAPPIRRFPTMRELGEKFRCSHTLIGKKAKSLGWLKRRKTFQGALEEETDRAVAKAAAFSTAEAVALVDKWIGRFEQNLREKRVRADNVGDLDRILRLREFLLGGADQRSENKTTFTLEQIQRRYDDRFEDARRGGNEEADQILAGVLTGSEAEGGAEVLFDSSPTTPATPPEDDETTADSTTNRQSEQPTGT